MDTRPVDLDAIASRNDFRKLSAARKRLGNGLAVIMAAIYFTFICMVAFSPVTLAQPVATGSSISVGIVVGVAVMASGFVLTAIYVFYASSRLDGMVKAVRETVQ